MKEQDLSSASGSETPTPQRYTVESVQRQGKRTLYAAWDNERRIYVDSSASRIDMVIRTDVLNAEAGEAP